MQIPLNQSSAPLRFDDDLRKIVPRVLDQLQNHLPVSLGISRQIDIGEAAAQLSDDLVFAKLLEMHSGRRVPTTLLNFRHRSFPEFPKPSRFGIQEVPAANLELRFGCYAGDPDYAIAKNQVVL